MPSKEQARSSEKKSSGQQSAAQTLKPVQQLPSATITQQAKISPDLLTPGDVLRLQSTVGNQASLQVFRVKEAAPSAESLTSLLQRTQRNVIQRNGAPPVLVRVWNTKIGTVTPQLNIGAVMSEVASVWGRGKITLTPGDLIDISIEAPSEDVLSKEDLKLWVASKVAPLINPYIENSKGKRVIDVVFVPKFGQWGHAFTSIIPASPTKPGSYEPFVGPVAIVTTDKTQRPAGAEQSREGQLDKSEGKIDEETAKKFVNLGIVDDTAHEIGHLFGLQHTEDKERKGAPPVLPAHGQIHWLMHANLYNQIAKVAPPRTLEQAKGFVKEAAKPHIHHVVQGKEWFVALRGIEIPPEDLDIATKNIISGAVWPPGWVTAEVEQKEKIG